MSGYYDNTDFFHSYMEMPRSKGLSFAGEWHQLEPLIPDPAGKNVLDLGCGMGWHCRYMEEHNAAGVLGIDNSRNMLGKAADLTKSERIAYRLCDLKEFEYPPENYDIVISNLVLHYVEDLEDIYRKVYRTLKPGGVFLFNIEHPSFTAGVQQEWIRSEDGKALYWPIDNYYYPGIRDTDFLGFSIRKYHHTLTQILNPLIMIGFKLTAVEEAMPPEVMMDIPAMDEEMRRPMMLLVRAENNDTEELVLQGNA